MPNAQIISVGGTDYNVKDEEGRAITESVRSDLMSVRSDLMYALEDTDLKNALRHNIVLTGKGAYSSGNGITFTVEDGHIVTANGTATENCYYGFIDDDTSLIGLKIGGLYACIFNTSDSNIVLQGYYYKKEGGFGALSISQNMFTIPNNAVGLWFRALVPQGTTLTNAVFSLDVYDELINFDELQNIVPLWANHRSITGSGVTYTERADGTFLVNGTADENQTSYFYFADIENNMLGLVPGNTYSCLFSTTDSNIQLQLFVNYGVSSFRQISIVDGKYVTIPSDATGYFFRIAIGRGVTVTNAIVNFRFYTMILPEYLYEKINELEAQIPSSLPSYWTQYLETKLPTLFNADMSVGFSGFSFAFITDMHWLFNQKKSPAILRWIKDRTSISTIVQGGDILSNYTYRGLDPDEAYMEYTGMTKDIDFINVFGNHDLDTDSHESDVYSKADFYSICQRTTESFVHWEVGTLCGYMDNPVQKVRMIFWDYSLRTYTLLTNWITELQTGWSVIVFTHFIWHMPTDTQPDATYGQPLINAVDSVYDTADCTIIGIVCGHLHADKSAVSVKGYPIIGTTCDASTGSQADDDPDNPIRTPGTTTEQAFDLFYINMTNKTINTIRIGAGDTSSDRSFTY